MSVTLLGETILTVVDRNCLDVVTCAFIEHCGFDLQVTPHSIEVTLFKSIEFVIEGASLRVYSGTLVLPKISTYLPLAVHEATVAHLDRSAT